MMAHLVGQGCRACNGDILFAETNGPKFYGYMGTKEYWNLREPRPILYLDGEDQNHLEVYASVIGSPGFVLRNAIDPTLPYPYINPVSGKPASRGHLCPCGSENVEVELWEGDVQLDVASAHRTVPWHTEKLGGKR